MNLTVTGMSFVNLTKSRTSCWSFKPLMTTVLIFTFSTPRLRALSMLSLTALNPFPGLRVMNSNLNGSKVSKEMLRCVRPFETKAGSFRVKERPFEVIPICFNPRGARECRPAENCKGKDCRNEQSKAKSSFKEAKDKETHRRRREDPFWQ